MEDGLELAARFSLPPNRKGLCGPRRFEAGNRAALRHTLKQFRAPYAYLSLIADANGLEPFEYDVVEAFWVGNKKLHGITDEDLAKVIRSRFVAPTLLSPARAEALIRGLPPRIYPHHSFHVFYIGSIAGVLKATARGLDACRVAWGEAEKAGRKSVQVRYKPLRLRRHSLAFAPPVRARWSLDETMPAPSSGEWVAAHWGCAAIPISGRQKKNLEKYTPINMALFDKRPRRERA